MALFVGPVVGYDDGTIWRYRQDQPVMGSRGRTPVERMGGSASTFSPSRRLLSPHPHSPTGAPHRPRSGDVEARGLRTQSQSPGEVASRKLNISISQA